MTIKVDSWWDIDGRKSRGEQLTPVEAFIHCQEPAGSQQEEEFSRLLQELIDFVWSDGFNASSDTGVDWS